MNGKLLIVSLLLCFPLGMIFADEQDEKLLEVVGIIKAIEKDSAGIPIAIELKEESHWLVEPFKKLLGQDAKSYKISLDETGKDLLGFVDRRVKASGTLQVNEQGESLFQVKKYESLIELAGIIQLADENKAPGEDVLKFQEEPQAMFKYRTPWSLNIEGDLHNELRKFMGTKIRARGTIVHNDGIRSFNVLRFDVVEKIVCTVANVERNNKGAFIQAKLSEEDAGREFYVILDEKATEMLNTVAIDAKIEIECVIEDRSGSLYLEVLNFWMQSPESDQEETKSPEENDWQFPSDEEEEKPHR